MNPVLIGHINRINHHNSDFVLGFNCQAVPIFQRFFQGLRVDSFMLTAFRLELAFQFGFCLDDFCTAGTEELKKAVLFAELEKHLPKLYGESPLELTHKIYEATRVTATMKEMENFCNRYVKTLKLKVSSEGKFVIEIQK